MLCTGLIYMSDIKLDFNKKEKSFNDEYSKMQYAKRHCGFEGAKPFTLAEDVPDNVVLILKEQSRLNLILKQLNRTQIILRSF